jgi:hypothetical protein
MALRQCLEPTCSALVPSGRCAAHQRRADHGRRATRVLTYSEAWWRRWRASFIQMLVAHDIPPVCGARLSSAPQAYQTLCQLEGRQTLTSEDGTGLHVHHEPELTEAEAINRAAVCDETRTILVCRRCHSVRTTGGPSQTWPKSSDAAASQPQPRGDRLNDSPGWA